tara:strand:- start:3017 stop:3298 length:282 start_codon:yes stop_codon:yes gene_type:complete
MRRESQKSKIMKYLKEGNSITPIDALEKFGCFRLAAIIHNIKQEKEFMENKDLVTSMVTNKFGVKYGSYKLKLKIKEQTNWVMNNQRVLGLVR